MPEKWLPMLKRALLSDKCSRFAMRGFGGKVAERHHSTRVTTLSSSARNTLDRLDIADAQHGVVCGPVLTSSLLWKHFKTNIYGIS